MRLIIDHYTRYSFSEPQARVVQLLRMTPADSPSQTVIDWQIDVDCDARLRPARDGYGNLTTMLYVDGPVDAITLTVRGEVLTDQGAEPIGGSAEPLAPSTFLRSTPLTTADAAIVELARSPVSGTMQGVESLCETIKSRLKIVPGRTAQSHTAADTVAEGRGSVRDCAHVLIAAARTQGIPARFVSGHCLGALNAGPRQSAHGWVEVWIDGYGWTGFDPSMACRVDENYVRVAVGLDASDTSPVSGARRGGGVEELDVDVRVAAGQ
jgi:transglutaminase-like putative cysteine protease